ncbi:MAG: MarR family transcriptional regulator [Lewinellaceae bacterium]|nr:MarR family transcriptional regulator [Phaeodactylibacter sp.]MCB0611859.1 MarR family transcriptional regulator [Phaeodactylibacter sp.]MCB9349137.1 MarR family transcriptional regulator [Lewinellaceae bacterium]
MKIEEEIQQRKFKSVYHKAHINVLFTASWLSQNSAQLLKPFKLSWQQFNILRILRGMHPEPATVKLLTERMIDKMSNASRLVEKLKQKGLVERNVCPADRRRVDIEITGKGLEVLEDISRIMEEELTQRMSTLTSEEASQLNQLLDKLRC